MLQTACLFSLRQNEVVCVLQYVLAVQIERQLLVTWRIDASLQDFSCLHAKSLLVTQFLKADTLTPEAHTRSAKPDTNSQPLTQFHKTLFHKTQHGSLCNTKIYQEVSWFPFLNTTNQNAPVIHQCFITNSHVLYRTINKHTTTHAWRVYFLLYCVILYSQPQMLTVKKFAFNLAFMFTVNFSTSLCRLLSILYRYAHRSSWKKSFRFWITVCIILGQRCLQRKTNVCFWDVFVIFWMQCFIL